MRLRDVLLCAVVGLCLPASAGATYHFMKIVEVFPGTPAQPDAQYVVLQMYDDTQNLVSGHAVTVHDAAGGTVGTFTFPGIVANGTDQDSILIATSAAATFFGITADLTMTAVVPLAGGKACWDTVDCVAWGSYGGGVTPSAVGTPFDAAGGLTPGSAIRRDLAHAGGATTLENADDTNDSAADFDAAVPAPRNNAGASGTIPPSTCGNGTLEGLEGCDDDNTTPGDGCDASCRSEAPSPTTSTTVVSTGSATTTTAVPCADPGYDGILCALAGVPPDACAVALPRVLIVKPSGLLARARDAATSRKAARLLGKSIKALRKAERTAAKARTVAKLGATCAQAVGAAVTDARTRAELLQAAS